MAEVDLPPSVPEVVPVESPPFLARAGVLLAAGVLAFMFVVAMHLLWFMKGLETTNSPAEVASVERLLDAATKQYLAASSPETLKEANDLARRLADARRSSREHWTGVTQILLLNLLLPVLTSILGYVFGTSRGNDS